MPPCHISLPVLSHLQQHLPYLYVPISLPHLIMTLVHQSTLSGPPYSKPPLHLTCAPLAAAIPLPSPDYTPIQLAAMPPHLLQMQSPMPHPLLPPILMPTWSPALQLSLRPIFHLRPLPPPQSCQFYPIKPLPHCLLLFSLYMLAAAEPCPQLLMQKVMHALIIEPFALAPHHQACPLVDSLLLCLLRRWMPLRALANRTELPATLGACTHPALILEYRYLEAMFRIVCLHEGAMAWSPHSQALALSSLPPTCD